MIKILDLFAGTQSVRKALDEMYEIDYGDLRNGVLYGQKEYSNFADVGLKDIVAYRGVDIYSPEEYNDILDLSQDDIVNKLKDILGDYKPDLIGASPICNKFSAATTGPNGNTYFVLENDEIRPRNKEEYIHVKHNKFNEKPERGDSFVAEANLALKLHSNLVEIINHFNVPFAIENPANALSKYVYKDYIRNTTHYCAYGFEYKKATAIYTNKELKLKKHSDKETHRHILLDRINRTDKGPTHGNKDISIYANRSSVPPKLIKEIIKQLTGGK